MDTIRGLLRQKLQDAEISPGTTGSASASVVVHLERASAKRKEGSFADAGVHYTRALSSHEAATPLTQEQLHQARSGVVAMMQLEGVLGEALDAVQSEKWEAALTVIERLRREERSAPSLQVLAARCHQKLGKWASAQRAVRRAESEPPRLNPRKLEHRQAAAQLRSLQLRSNPTRDIPQPHS